MLKKLALAGAALLLSANLAFAQGVPVKYFSTTGTNSTNVYPSKANLSAGLLVNTTTTVYYLKFYDKATAPTCGTDIPKWTVPLPVSEGGVPLSLNQGLDFANGIGFCVTGGIADNDTSTAAAGIVVNLGISGR